MSEGYLSGTTLTFFTFISSPSLKNPIRSPSSTSSSSTTFFGMYKRRLFRVSVLWPRYFSGMINFLSKSFLKLTGFLRFFRQNSTKGRKVFIRGFYSSFRLKNLQPNPKGASPRDYNSSFSQKKNHRCPSFQKVEHGHFLKPGWLARGGSTLSPTRRQQE